MATVFSYSKTLPLTNTTLGHKFTPADFIPTTRQSADASFVCNNLMIQAISTGTVTIKINDADDWVPVTAGWWNENLRMTQFWLKPSASNTVSVLIGFIGVNRYQ